MPDLSVARLEYCAIHYAGNKNNDEGTILSKQLVSVSDEKTRNTLLKYFLNSFKEDDIQCFSHHTALEMNEVYTISTRLFADPESLLLRSVELVTHLYENTMHPNIPGGEVIVAYFDDCYLDGITCPAIGVFKVENKERFLRFEHNNGNYSASYNEGININKPDKACLIFEQDAENGYKVLVIENSKSGETRYWRDQFLGLKPASDQYQFTSRVLKMTRDFVTRELPSSHPLEKMDSVEFLNRSIDYFKSNDAFEQEDFAAAVFEDSEIVASFKKYDEDYCRYNEVPQSTHFEIDDRAVKKQARIFKSVLKLDKNFHIYIHGNRKMIEKGLEPDGRKFYKIYFEEEN